MPKVKKLPKWAIKQAGGINKKAWALARRGKGRKMSRAKPSKRAPRRSSPRAVGGASHGGNSKPGWGRYFKMGRTVDVLTGPAQGSVGRHGVTRAAGEEVLLRFSAGMSQGAFDQTIAKGTYGGIGTGMLRNWLRSKLGIYRGVGQKKYLSIVMAANPEILASTDANPVTDVVVWNEFRSQYDRAYAPAPNGWDLNPQSDWGARFWRSMGLDAGLKVAQKAAEKWVNPMLPAGHNL